MANAFYNKGREGFALAEVDWVDDDIRCILIDTADYTVNLSTHDFLDDVPSGARVATSSSLTGKSATDGVLDADDITFSTVTGDPSEALIIYKHTGTESTSRLLLYIDTATGLPVTPNGGDVDVEWDSGSNKIGKL